MKQDKKGLGKGLDAIFGSSVSDVLDDIQAGHVDAGTSKTELPTNLIKPNPYQPRIQFSDDKIHELAQSIEQHGVFTPILVKKSVNGYELIAGERRLRAAKMINLANIPAIVVDFDDKQMMEIALLENIQRENLNAIEEAKAYAKLIEKLNYTQDELAQRIGKSRVHVTNLLRLLKLPNSVQQLVIEDRLSMGHVRALVSIEDVEDLIFLANKAAEEGLSVRKVEALAKALNQPTSVKPEKVETYNFDFVQQQLLHKFQTPVKVDDKHITITYNGNDDLNRILELIGCLEQQEQE
ncbi:MAG: ParB/RepB/Spo0J family partition protein [Erysipelotrichaceae bacterium]